MDLRPEGQKLIAVGKRFSVEKEKCQRHEDKDEQGQAFEKLASRLTKVDGIDQAWLVTPCPRSECLMKSTVYHQRPLGEHTNWQSK